MERTIFYQNDAQGVLELKDNIIAAEAKIDFNKEGSPIYDVIQEFDREAQIIKISETQFVDQSDKENSNILWYILQKLNNLEDSVQAIRSLSLRKSIFLLKELCLCLIMKKTLGLIK